MWRICGPVPRCLLRGRNNVIVYRVILSDLTHLTHFFIATCTQNFCTSMVWESILFLSNFKSTESVLYEGVFLIDKFGVDVVNCHVEDGSVSSSTGSTSWVPTAIRDDSFSDRSTDRCMHSRKEWLALISFLLTIIYKFNNLNYNQIHKISLKNFPIFTTSIYLFHNWPKLW